MNAKFDFFADLPEWQQRMMERMMSGERLSFGAFPRRTGKRDASVSWAAAMEMNLQKWDVIGPDAPLIRRLAREAAARAANRENPAGRG